METNLATRCDRLRARKATQEELQVVHTEAHSILFGSNQVNRQKIEASRASFVVRFSLTNIKNIILYNVISSRLTNSAWHVAASVSI
jgi:hypothetical protein